MIAVKKEGTIHCVDRAVAGSCGDQTSDQPRSGDLVHVRSHTKDGPLAKPESQRTESITTHILSDRSGSDHNSGAAYLTIKSLIHSMQPIAL